MKESDLQYEQVMVQMPSEAQIEDWKLSSYLHSPYRVLQVSPNNIKVHLIDQLKDTICDPESYMEVLSAQLAIYTRDD